MLHEILLYTRGNLIIHSHLDNILSLLPFYRHTTGTINTLLLLPRKVLHHVLTQVRETSKWDTKHDNCSSLCPHNNAFLIEDLLLHKLIDSGAVCSIWLVKFVKDKSPLSPITLQGVNHSPILMYSQTSLSLDLVLYKDLKWIFINTNLPYLILSADFLHHYSFMVDVCQQFLLDSNTDLDVFGRKLNTWLVNSVFFIE